MPGISLASVKCRLVPPHGWGHDRSPKSNPTTCRMILMIFDPNDVPASLLDGTA
ncbi:MAG TPA: hypothetical protein VHX14_05400 [Thermoanaerobaculia bacterium]|nr:hypothetical protein [Thermoanaerobaculia bacterium]